MNYKYYNPNPKSNSAGDCVVRMLCKVTGMPWVNAYISLVDRAISLGDMPSANHVWWAYLEDLGFKRHIIPNTCPYCYTIDDFAKDNPVGTFVVGTGTHVVAVENGNYYDTWNSGDEIPLFYFSK